MSRATPVLGGRFAGANAGAPRDVNVSESNADLLGETLALGVPFRIHELLREHAAWTCEPHQAEARVARQLREAQSIVASRGDAMLMGGKNVHEVVAALLTALALGAICHPAGITYRGRHWCHGSCTQCERAA